MYIFSESARQPWEVVQPPPMRSIVTRGEPQSGLAVTGSSCYVGVWLLGAPEPPPPERGPSEGTGQKQYLRPGVCETPGAPFPVCTSPALHSPIAEGELLKSFSNSVHPSLHC